MSRALTLAGLDSLAVLPAAQTIRYLRAWVSTGPLPRRAATNAVRTNLTLTESDGTTAKSAGQQPHRYSHCRGAHCRGPRSGRRRRLGDSVGSLPPGMDDKWYSPAGRTPASRMQIAVDTSDARSPPLAAGFDRAAPHLIKPNSEELAHLAASVPATWRSRSIGTSPPRSSTRHTLIARGARRSRDAGASGYRSGR